MENLNDLGLPEIKSLCKKYDIGIVGDKKDLIKNKYGWCVTTKGICGCCDRFNLTTII